MDNTNGKIEPRINVEVMRIKSLAAASLSAWINNWLDIAKLSTLKSAPKTPTV
jgi:hypothetical protein